ncbi:MAG: hypothetical protein HKN04_14195 [Rhodothermaceae bacterium]|nr:hypothetical protein [Rhodothermaceae bacterium]
MSYRLRFFFDPGSGVCFWTASDAIYKRFGYPVELSELPLSATTRRAGEHLIGRFNTSLNWADPSSSSPAGESDTALFDEDASAWLAIAKGELGPDYEVIDEHSVRPIN